MFVFLSYAREDRELAERIRGTVVAAGFECFLDTRSLPPGQEYNSRIREAVARADLFIFLLSTAAVEPGSYALTELAFAEKKWPNPAGYVLPVASANFDCTSLPAYLRPINVLQPHGNTEAEVLAWVQDRAERGGGGGEETPGERLDRWARLHQPPLRRARKLPLRNVLRVLAGLAFIAFGIVAGQSNVPIALTLIPMLLGCGLILFALLQSIQGLMGAKAVAALVLDRSERRDVTIHLLLTNDRRISCSPVGRSAASAYPGEIGWAFIAGGLLLGFERGRPTGS